MSGAGDKAVADALDGAEDLEPLPPADEKLAGLSWNDIGNGERLIARHGHDMKFVERVGMHVWDKTRWNIEGGDFEAQKRAHLTVKKLFAEAEAFAKPAREALEAARAALAAHMADKPSNRDRAERFDWEFQIPLLKEAVKDAKALYDDAAKMYGFATLSGNAAKLKGMVEQAKPYLRCHPRQMDADPYKLATPDGTLWLLRAKRKDGVVIQAARVEMHQHRRDDLITKLAGVRYDPAAKATLWESVVETALPDPEVRAFVQRFFGYCLTGSIDEQVMMICYGKGANAKSTIIETIAAALGELSVTVPFATFIENPNKRGGDHTPDLVRMVGARLVTASEPNLSDRLSEGTIKQVTGGERITAREMFEKQFEFTPQFKVAVSANFKPTIKGQDDGIWRRLLLVPFLVTIPEAQRDRELPQKLRAELPGVMRWLVDGFLDWAERGLAVPQVIRDTIDDYRRESDPVGEFLRVATNKRPEAQTQASALYKAYQAWCVEVGREPRNQTVFGRSLGDRGLARSKSSAMYYAGLELSVDGLKLLESGKRAPHDGAAAAADGEPPVRVTEQQGGGDDALTWDPDA